MEVSGEGRGTEAERSSSSPQVEKTRQFRSPSIARAASEASWGIFPMARTSWEGERESQLEGRETSSNYSERTHLDSAWMHGGASTGCDVAVNVLVSLPWFRDADVDLAFLQIAQVVTNADEVEAVGAERGYGLGASSLGRSARRSARRFFIIEGE